ncbi:MAG: phosphoenolpyruvate--protein phosphotransferase [Candidatus Firestonebacteria bacterium]|nr:phosphoenolpyruvate--protein phosphotransferase [Candidatus Firestonebacteria bacterium]
MNIQARTIINGIAASPGLAVGKVCFWSDPENVPRYTIDPEQVPEELARLDEALASARQQLVDLQERVEKEIGHEEAAIFTSHSLLLDDPAFYARVEKFLTQEHINLEAAVEMAIEDIVKVLRKIPDLYLRERADDFRDVGRRVLENLLAYQRQCTLEEGGKIILVAHELMPSDTVQFHRHHVGAFVTERGGVSSHAAILARSLRLPAVVSVPQILSQLQAGVQVLVDGRLGRVIVNPDPTEIEEAERDQTLRAKAAASVHPAVVSRTLDQVEVVLSANLTREDEAEEARMVGARGVGLLRTEFLFMDRGEFLDEEKQYRAYRHVVEIMAPHPVTIRTLDLGEDKQFNFENPVEATTACVLGWRSLRLSLADENVFSAQLRAILRASAHGVVRILLPMVTGIEELRLVRGLLAKAQSELTTRGLAFGADVQLGAMIETPSAAVLPELILQEADFLSVGTNDLVQYIMVADRVSEHMQRYYRSTSPAVISLLAGMARAARTAGKDISICGEIAGDPLYLPLLLGLGFRNLSVAPVLIPDLAAAVAGLKISEAEDLAARCLRLSTADEIEALLRAKPTPAKGI